jgi:tRNA A37 threonylcarbamoyltransferase TsaD
MAEVVVETETKPATPNLKFRLEHLIESGNARLAELDERLARVSKDDWSFSGIRRRVEALRPRAEHARDDALKRLDKLPAQAISAVASVSRERVQDLARGLKWVEKRLDGSEGTASDIKH